MGRRQQRFAMREVVEERGWMDLVREWARCIPGAKSRSSSGPAPAASTPRCPQDHQARHQVRLCTAPLLQLQHTAATGAQIHYANLSDSFLCCTLDSISPDEVYNLATQSHVCVAFKIPNYTVNVIPCHHIEMSGSTQPRRRHRAKTHCSTHAPAMPPPRSRRSVTPSTTARHTTSSGNNALFNHESTPWRELTRKIMT